MKIYLAGPLFSEAERDWLAKMKEDLVKAGYNAVWPYELFDQAELASLGQEAAKKIMTGCRDALLDCQLVVALLDGTQVDDGTAWEIGFANAKKIPVAGIRTDARRAGETPDGKVNAMIEASCAVICENRSDLLRWLDNHMV